MGNFTPSRRHEHTLFHFGTIMFLAGCSVKHWVFRLVTLTSEAPEHFQFHYVECESPWVMPAVVIWCCSPLIQTERSDGGEGGVRKGEREGRNRRKLVERGRGPSLIVLCVCMIGMCACTSTRVSQNTCRHAMCDSVMRRSADSQLVCSDSDKGHYMYICVWEVCV